MGQSNSLPKTLVPYAKRHLRMLWEIQQQPALLEDSPRLAKAIQSYIEFMNTKATKGNTALKNVTLDTMWMWHIHKIYPLKYMEDCKMAYGYVVPLNSPIKLPTIPTGCSAFAPSLDLIHGAANQSKFIRNVEPFFSATDENLLHLGHQYEKFLKLIPQVEAGNHLVPAVGIDLMWHTHMMIPERYEKDTVAITGKVLDHEDTLDAPLLASNLDYTEQLWKRHYKEGYIMGKINSLTCAMTFHSESANTTSSQTTGAPTESPTTPSSAETLIIRNEVTWDKDTDSPWFSSEWDSSNNNPTSSASASSDSSLGLSSYSGVGDSIHGNNFSDSGTTDAANN